MSSWDGESDAPISPAKLTAEHVAISALRASGLIALPSVPDLARALWITDGCDPEIWDDKRGRQWQAYMNDKRPEYLKKAELLTQLLSPPSSDA